MQYGNLDLSQQERFIIRQRDAVRKPSFVVWIEGFGDTTEYVIDIDTEIGLESLRGKGNINIGRAILELNNEKGYFYSEGASKIRSGGKIKIWAGFDSLNIPIFTGIIHSVKPIGTLNTVVINCRDYMGFFFNSVVGELGLNNTPKSILEYLCSKVGVLSEIDSNEETMMSYDEPKFSNQRIIGTIEDICDSIFSVAYFDENGTFKLVEKEYSNPSKWKFHDGNVIDCNILADSEIINDITIEYKSGFSSRCYDQASIDEYKLKSRQVHILSLGSDLVSSQSQGTGQEILDNNLEGFKFSSSIGSSLIDTIHIRMKKSEAHGYILAKIFTDDNGVPNSLIGTSSLKVADNLNNDWTWEVFSFDKPIEISQMTDYWCIIDSSSVVSGTVYVQVSNTAIIGRHAHYNLSSWLVEDNKSVLHVIRGSRQSQRIACDVIRFYKKPHERISIIAPAIPNLQLTDEVMVDIKKVGVIGKYIIERRRHILTSEKYVTIDTLRKAE